MWKARLILAGLLILAGSMFVAAQPEPVKTAASPSVREEIAAREQQLARMFADFEKQVLQLKQRLERTGKAEDAARAKILAEVLERSQKQSLALEVERMVDAVQKLNTKNLGDLKEAMDRSNRIAEELSKLLELLRSDPRLKQSQDERKFLKELVTKLEKAIEKQKMVEGQTQFGKTDARELESNQRAVTKDVAKIKESIDKFIGKDGKGEDPNKLKGENKDAGKGDGQKSEAKGDGETPQQIAKGEPKEGNAKDGNPAQPKDGKGGTGKDGSPMQPKDGKGGAGKDGSPMTPKDGKGGAGKDGGSPMPKDGKGPSGKDGDPKDKGKDGNPDSGSKVKTKDDKKDGSPEATAQDGKQGSPSAKQGQAKAGDKADGKSDAKGDGQPKAGSPSSGPPQAAKKGDGSPPPPGGDQNPPPPGKQGPKDDIAKSKKQIEDANYQQKKAEDNIAKKDLKPATDNQNQAIKDLEDAKKKLEELLRQAREEEMERLLANLQARCEKMLVMQQQVLGGTEGVFKGIEATATKTPDNKHRQDSLKLSDTEKEIVVEATKAIELLEADGSAVAFPEVFQQVREDMKHVQRRLEVVDTGVVTQAIEKDIIESLKEMIEALKKARKDLEDKKSPPPKEGSPPPNQDNKLLELIQELKMVRSLQVRVNTRTQTYGKMYQNKEGEQTSDPIIRRELNNLADRQERIYDITNKIAKGENR